MNQQAYILGYMVKVAYDMTGQQFADLQSAGINPSTFDPSTRGALKTRLTRQVQQGLTRAGQSLAGRAPSRTGVPEAKPFDRPGQLVGTQTRYGRISVNRHPTPKPAAPVDNSAAYAATRARIVKRMGAGQQVATK